MQRQDFNQEKDVIKFFGLSSVALRPEAAQIIHARLIKIPEDSNINMRRGYLEKMLKCIKEKQALLMHNPFAMGNGIGQIILDRDTAVSILGDMPLNETYQCAKELLPQQSKDRQSTIAMTQGGLSAGGFKQMKMKAAIQKQQQLEDDEIHINTEQTSQIEHQIIIASNPLIHDRVYQSLQEKTVILEDFTQIPTLRLHNGQIFFLNSSQQGSKRSLIDVVDARQEYYALRLALGEERVFSHSQRYQRAKLNGGYSTVAQHNPDGTIKKSVLQTVFKVNSILGATCSKWVIGILNQKEDGNYYLEDETLSVRVSFGNLEHVDCDSFFNEGSLILCQGIYEGEQMSIRQIKQPPFHARKSFIFKINESDYFGAYTKQKNALSKPVSTNGGKLGYTETGGLAFISKRKVNNEAQLLPPDNSIVIISQLELDQTNTQRALVKLLEGLEQMRSDIIVLVGDFISQRISEKVPFDNLRQYFDIIASIVKEKELICLRDQTQWIMVPSVDDPAQTKMMPCLPFSEFFISGPRSVSGGNNQRILKNVTLASNPLRLSYYGKEIVISRYNYFKKLKRNYLPEVQAAQESIIKQKGIEQVSESFKIAKTILSQGNLIPLPPIVQPVMWSFAKDCLNLVPHPDFLILADDCNNYYHKIPVDSLFKEEPQKHVHVVNPGNFSYDHSFVLLYPGREEVKLSKINF